MIWIIIPLIFIFLIILIILSPLKCVVWVNSRIKGIHSKKELIYTLAAMATIFTLFLAMNTYYEERKIIEENNQIILSNLKQEIEINLGFIEWFEKNSENMLKTEEFPEILFDYTFLEQSLNILKNKDTREKIFWIIKFMKNSNNRLNDFNHIFIPEDKFAYDTYKNLKEESVLGLNITNYEIKNLLLQIKEDPQIKNS